MRNDLREILSYARLEQLPRYAARVLSQSTARREDYFPDVAPADVKRMSEIAMSLRGTSYTPAIFIHGVLPRSGTNFLADALSLHPDVVPYPQRLWEFPLLSVAKSTAALQREFQFMFPPNKEVMHRYEFLSYLASGWLKCMQDAAGGKRLLFKDPHVHNLGLFRYLFPNDMLALCLRDGRDVAESSQKTFGDWLRRKTLKQISNEWKFGCEAILEITEGEQQHTNAMVVRYEQLVLRPDQTITKLLNHFGLELDKYDFDQLAKLPVRGSSTSQSADAQRWQPHEKSADFQPIGRWKNWSKNRKDQFKDAAGETLIRAGYENNLDW